MCQALYCHYTYTERGNDEYNRYGPCLCWTISTLRLIHDTWAVPDFPDLTFNILQESFPGHFTLSCSPFLNWWYHTFKHLIIFFLVFLQVFNLGIAHFLNYTKSLTKKLCLIIFITHWMWVNWIQWYIYTISLINSFWYWKEFGILSQTNNRPRPNLSSKIEIQKISRGKRCIWKV